MTRRTTLLAQLARSSHFSKHGEYMCTWGLTHVLNHREACDLFCRMLAERSGLAIPHDVHWFSEAWQVDQGRPDLEARRTSDDKPVVKIEAKLGALLGADQVESYAKDIVDKNPAGPALLVLLVPGERIATAAEEAAKLFDPTDHPRVWASTKGVRLLILTWQDVFDALAPAESVGVANDVEQLRGMVMTLLGMEVVPLTQVDLRHWRERRDDLSHWVDEATRRLYLSKPYPFGDESGYWRRYIGRHMRGEWVFFSIGVRHPMEPHTTPIWLRYDKGQRLFPFIQAQLVGRYPDVVESAGHLWIPIEVTEDVAGHDPVGRILAVAGEVHRLVWGVELVPERMPDPGLVVVPG